jgi:hypothetical protein
MFATAMLAVVSDIAMDLVENISGALFVTNIFNSILGGTDATAGMMQASLQQFGLGLILSTLLITTPPMAGSFFNGMMGQFSGNNPLDRFGSVTQRQAPQGSLGSAGVPTATVGARGANGAPAPIGNNGSRGVDAAAPTPVGTYIPQTNASVNQDVIKPSSDIGNASKGFASYELVQADKSVKDQAVKLSLMLVSGALVWSGVGVREAQAQSGYWEQAQQQQQQMQRQQEQINQQNQMMYSPQYACVGGRDVYGYIGDAACGGGVYPSNTAPPPVIQKPSSYGAVAENKKTGLIVGASKQASKQASINTALQKCGDLDNCAIAVEYSNQCVVATYGRQLNGQYWVDYGFGLTKTKAEKAGVVKCSKRAKNCKILLSECSLP